MQKLFGIQQELKAPKKQYNRFGEFNFRSCEDILEAVKPLLQSTSTVLTLTDDIIQLGDRYYIKATAALYDETGKEIHHCCAFAREAEQKTKMDVAQITGASSSYARKYALNGLFAIDDVKDPDTTNKYGKDDKESSFDEKIITGLKDISTIADLNKYYGEYKKDVNDLKAFQTAYSARAKEITGGVNV